MPTGLKRDAVLMPKLLKNAGYTTHAVGKYVSFLYKRFDYMHCH